MTDTSARGRSGCPNCVQDREKALQLSGKPFVFSDGRQGFPCVVTAADVVVGGASSVTPTSASTRATSAKDVPEDYTRVYLSNLLIAFNEEDVRKLCVEYGDVRSIDVLRNPHTRISRGFAYVEFSDTDGAHRAVRGLNLKVVEGQRLRAKPARGHNKVKGKSDSRPSSASARANGSTGSTAGAAAAATTNIHAPRTSDRDGDSRKADADEKGNQGSSHRSSSTSAATLWALDGGSKRGVAMTPADRLSLMAELGGGRGSEMLREANAKAQQASSAKAAVASANDVAKPATAVAAAAAVTPTSKGQLGASQASAQDLRHLVISNMFDPKSEEGHDWDKEIAEDLRDECAKFGKVISCVVDRHSPEGKAFLAFSSPQEAAAAEKVLHGRWFDKRQLKVRFLTEAAFRGQLPK
ncbi:RNA-binding protein, putative [Hondaea fermentalgiana]|uniref:RNA-binding protein, putative n=1 Tax=Hondaea fermentalgiana TaxID=2315210 RepID=A0A2R5GWV8_9STRA|nr:RNA-binding protein, putative [Hondaea fermentalgiana]|eukprot:GBG32424.1 RNA-binding protein, putative [Hondaea fermentalgiana]